MLNRQDPPSNQILTKSLVDSLTGAISLKGPFLLSFCVFRVKFTEHRKKISKQNYHNNLCYCTRSTKRDYCNDFYSSLKC